MVKMLRRTVRQLFKKLKMKLPRGPADPLLAVCPRELKAGLEDVDVHPCEKQLFTTAMLWKWPKQPPMMNRQANCNIYRQQNISLKRREVLTPPLDGRSCKGTFKGVDHSGERPCDCLCNLVQKGSVPRQHVTSKVSFKACAPT